MNIIIEFSVICVSIRISNYYLFAAWNLIKRTFENRWFQRTIPASFLIFAFFVIRTISIRKLIGYLIRTDIRPNVYQVIYIKKFVETWKTCGDKRSCLYNNVSYLLSFKKKEIRDGGRRVYAESVSVEGDATPWRRTSHCSFFAHSAHFKMYQPPIKLQ